MCFTVTSSRGLFQTCKKNKNQGLYNSGYMLIYNFSIFGVRKGTKQLTIRPEGWAQKFHKKGIYLRTSWYTVLCVPVNTWKFQSLSCNTWLHKTVSCVCKDQLFITCMFCTQYQYCQYTCMLVKNNKTKRMILFQGKRHVLC